MSDPYKILFTSRHFYLDQSNGASISTRSLLQELAKRRWNVKTFCGFQQDYIRPTTIETELAKHELQLQRTWGNNEGRLVSFKDYGISSLAFITPQIPLKQTLLREAIIYRCSNAFANNLDQAF